MDPRVASEADTRIELSAIYTALLTKSPDDSDERPVRRDEERALRGLGDRRLSALAQLNMRQRLVLLGDPGSGKSTFVNFVAQCLTGQALSHPVINLQLLTEPLPDDGAGEKKEPQRQKWTHEVLLPVMVVLRDFAAKGLPPVGQIATAKHILTFINTQLDSAGLADFAPHLERELHTGCLLLLDGLDEVPEADKRRVQLRQAVEDFANTFANCRILVTSRTYAYQKQDWRLNGFHVAELAPFTGAQINSFVDRWYAHIGPLRKMGADKSRAQAGELKRSIAGSRRLSEFAERPLLLALMASLHAWRGGRLPEKRESLYNDSVELLLETWERAKQVEGLRQPSLSEWLDVDRDRVRALLNELAYTAHARQPELEGTADIPEGDLVTGLMRLSENREANPAHLMDYLSQRAGLLLPHGVGVYTFPHRTFQEYLAACYLTDKNYPSEVARLARQDPSRWREVALLAGAKAARGGLFGAWALANKLCPRDPREPGQSDERTEDSWGALLAAQAIAESIDLERIEDADDRAALARLQGWLVHILRANTLPAVERVLAGDTLAKLGDPRFNPAVWHLPAESMLGFIEIPAGKFLMGTRKADVPRLIEQFGGDKDYYNDEVEQHSVDLAAFYIARYPVTVAQFRAFVEASGHKPANENALRGLPNHPVVSVTWHDAIAYCNWLTETLRAWKDTPEPLKGLLDKGWVITLPSEAEWEKAARGDTSWVFPWGDAFDADCANTNEAGIGGTSPVGCFAKGASPYRVRDMSGNVWEWTRSMWGKNFEKPDFKYPYNLKDKKREDLKAPNDVLRVLRGGSFIYVARYARCAFRFGDDPCDWYDYLGFRVMASPILSRL